MFYLTDVVKYVHAQTSDVFSSEIFGLKECYEKTFLGLLGLFGKTDYVLRSGLCFLALVSPEM